MLRSWYLVPEGGSLEFNDCVCQALCFALGMHNDLPNVMIFELRDLCQCEGDKQNISITIWLVTSSDDGQNIAVFMLLLSLWILAWPFRHATFQFPDSRMMISSC